ncbi:MAG TPA: hypothetical protein PK127_04605 [Clostridiales bacterium]|nr:hypothetical protein [Clostridiales bacterium]
MTNTVDTLQTAERIRITHFCHRLKTRLSSTAAPLPIHPRTCMLGNTFVGVSTLQIRARSLSEMPAGTKSVGLSVCIFGTSASNTRVMVNVVIRKYIHRLKAGPSPIRSGIPTTANKK